MRVQDLPPSYGALSSTSIRQEDALRTTSRIAELVQFIIKNPGSSCLTCTIVTGIFLVGVGVILKVADFDNAGIACCVVGGAMTCIPCVISAKTQHEARGIGGLIAAGSSV